jgi:hypothetical protein
MDKVSARDKVYFLLFLSGILYFSILAASGCRWVDGPFAFVRGCYNYGIDWNSFMAPVGFVVICGTFPLSIVYWLLKLLKTIFKLGWRLILNILGRFKI